MAHSKTQELARALIRIDSVTPNDNGCQDLLAKPLKDAGFSVEFTEMQGTRNMLALHGSGSPFLLFLGHTDVVSPGEPSEWKYPPYEAHLVHENGTQMLYGRGSADMKSSDACMSMAIADFVREDPGHRGTLGFLITSNEEGNGKGGVRDMVPILKERGLVPDYCIVGEPSSSKVLGDSVKVGRRGSLSALFTVHGVQGHVAYPQLLVNPIHLAGKLIDRLNTPLDSGSGHFPPTSFEVTNIKAGTGAENQVPASCFFMCNWRFNDLQSKDSIEKFVTGHITELGIKCDVTYILNGEPFLSDDGRLIGIITSTIKEELGVEPSLSTSGGTSDGRFIAPMGTQTLEFGLVSKTIHQVNECTNFEDINRLKTVFQKITAKLLEQ